MSIQAKNIRNVVFAGHASKGKTTLCEALLNVAGTTERMGKTADSNTVLDFDSEEKKRKISVNSAVASFEYKGKNINLIDTPGLFDFAMGMSEGMRAADTAVIVVSARSGLAVGAEKAFKSAGSHGLSRIFVTTKMEDERADFYKSFNGIVAKFGTQVCPVVVPVISDGKVVAYYNMIDSKTYEYDGTKRKESALTHDDEARFEAIKAVFAEAVASTDEELMEKYFEGEELTSEEKIKGLRLGVADGSIIPVFALSGITGIACDMLLDFIADVCPSPKSEYAIDSNGEPVELTADENGPLAAICFKTVADPFIGKLSYFKVISGKFNSSTPAFNANTGKEVSLLICNPYGFVDYAPSVQILFYNKRNGYPLFLVCLLSADIVHPHVSPVCCTLYWKTRRIQTAQNDLAFACPRRSSPRACSDQRPSSMCI